MTRNQKIALMIMKQIEMAMQEGRAKEGICSMFDNRVTRITKRVSMPFQMTVDLNDMFRSAMGIACAELGYNTCSEYPIPGIDGLDAFSTYHKFTGTPQMWDRGEYGIKRRVLFYNVYRQLGGIS